jgi:Domain of unknown function (DUF4386)
MSTQANPKASSGDTSTVQRIGGLAGIVYGVAALAFTVAIGSVIVSSSFTPNDFSNSAKNVQLFAANRALLLPAHLGVLFAAVFALVLVYAFSRTFRLWAPELSTLASLFGYAGFLLNALVFTIEALYINYLGNTWANVPGVAEQATPAFNLVTQAINPFSLICVSVWVCLMSVAAWHGNILPRLLAYLGLVVTIVAAISVVASYFGPALNPLTTVAVLLQAIWLIWSGVVLMRGQSSLAQEDRHEGEQHAQAMLTVERS